MEDYGYIKLCNDDRDAEGATAQSAIRTGAMDRRDGVVVCCKPYKTPAPEVPIQVRPKAL